MIREVMLTDAPALAEMYNYYIRTSIITFEETGITSDEMERRIRRITLEQGFPYIVLEENGALLGYAYATTWRERNAYRFSVESTIYIHPEHFGKGAGSQLYGVLLPMLQSRGIKAVIGGISLPNEASVRIHEKFGFEKVAHFKRVGYKFDTWIDVGFWELLFENND